MPCYTRPHSYCKHDGNERENILCYVLSAVTKLDEENKRILENLQDKLNYYQSNSDKITNMLCSVMGEIEYQDPGIVLDNDVKEWWEKHKKFDEQRKLK